MSRECRSFGDAARALEGTWVIDELKFAVEKGFKILEIYEIYEYRVTQNKPETGVGGLFVEYIDTFYKLKAEASHYLSWVRTSADEDQYVEMFQQSMGVRLDKDSKRYNAAKRGLAKL